MTKIDFYITDAKTPAELYSFACRLTEKAYRQKHAIYLHTDSEQTMQAVDDLLWSFRPNSFLPHTSEKNGSEQNSGDSGESKTDEDAPKEILVACSGNPGAHHDVLINLTEQTPEFFSRFTRVAEVVSGDEGAKEKSRQRFKFYRDRGYPLDVHNL